MGLNVFVLHNVDNFSSTLRNIADYVLCFERYAPQHNYIYHKITEPVTPALRCMRFDAIIIDSTALGICRYRPVEKWYAEKKRWSFLADSNAVKVVFPQDDYHQSQILDELFDDWNIDVIYSVIPNYHSMLYPRSSKRSRIEVVLTGYVDDHSLLDIGKFVKPFEQRSIDLGQRVTFYWPRGGRFAQLKGRLAVAAKQNALRAGFRVDVSTRDEDRIFGDDWFRFLGDCRFITGCESGVSVWDPDGAISDRVVDYSEMHPEAPFEEVEKACFPGEDGKYVFSAISPRLFEAAMARCCQILIEAPYLGVLKPHDHYIPVKPDLSNIADAVEEMRDFAGAQRRIANCYAALIETPEYRYSAVARRVMGAVEELRSSRHLESMPTRAFLRLGARHESQLVWLRRRALWQSRLELLQLIARRVLVGVRSRIYRLLRRILPRPIRQAGKRLLGYPSEGSLQVGVSHTAKHPPGG